MKDQSIQEVEKNQEQEAKKEKKVLIITNKHFRQNKIDDILQHLITVKNSYHVKIEMKEEEQEIDSFDYDQYDVILVLAGELNKGHDFTADFTELKDKNVIFLSLILNIRFPQFGKAYDLMDFLKNKIYLDL